MKKAKKQIMDITEMSFIGAGSSMALGGLGGGAATHGQQGIANTMRFAPAMGSMVRIGALMRTTKKMYKKK